MSTQAGFRPGEPGYDEWIREEGRKLAHRSRAAQGLAPTITDPKVLGRLAVLFQPIDDLKVRSHTAGEGVAERVCGKRSSAAPELADREAS
jgi:hypothetical protein